MPICYNCTERTERAVMGSGFRWLLSSTAAGSLGDGIAATALPLLLVGLTTSPALISLLQVAAGLPWLLFGLHAGALVDRFDRRTVLWVADAVRASFATVLVGLVAFHLVTVTALLLVAFLDGAATVFFRSAAPTLIPTLVEQDDLLRANSQVQTAAVATDGFVGPSLGGMLYSLASVLPFVAQSISMLVSVMCLRRLPSPAAATRAGSRSVNADIREGIRFVLTDTTIRALVVTSCLLAASTGMLQSVLVLHTVVTLAAPKSSYGFLFTIFATGYLAGTWITPRLRNQFQARTCLIIAAAVGTVSLTLIAAAPTIYAAGVGMGLLGIGSMIYNVTATTTRQQRTPAPLLGRISSIINLVSIGVIPISALLAGALVTAFGTTPALLAASGLCAAGLLWLLTDLGPTSEPSHSIKGS